MTDLKLIADSGSTKTAWAMVTSSGCVECTRTAGCNALTATDDEITAIAAEALEAFGADRRRVVAIEWYGAGCATEEVCAKTAEALRRLCSEARVHAASDLEGAARAVFGNKSGVACILGTGSNSGLYDGSQVVMNVPPLGYILGDEGGGAALGKRLVADALRGMLPEALTAELAADYGVTKENVLQRVYRQPGGNTFLASTVPFLARHREDEAVRHILIEVFSSFFERNIDLYPECRDYRLGFVGSVAYHFAEELRQVASSMGYFIDAIITDPIERLAHQTLSES